MEKNNKKTSPKKFTDTSLAIILSGLLIAFSILVTTDGFQTVGSYLVGSSENVTVITQEYFDSCVENSYGDDCYVIHKFGHSDNIGTTLVPVSSGEIYRTPKTLTSLEIVSDNTEDNSTGLGARKIEIQGFIINTFVFLDSGVLL